VGAAPPDRAQSISQSRKAIGELSMTLEDNFMVNRFVEALGATRYKTYRIYQRSLDGKGAK
jgi:hypothetical protein